jgi:hypothetical protein
MHRPDPDEISCKSCFQPLVVELDRDDSDEETVTASNTVSDDVQLPCFCHFHW